MADWEAMRTQAFDVLMDLTKQMITLSTGFIALTITFRKDILGATHHGQTAVLGSAWIAFILCIVAGVFVLHTLAGNLGKASHLEEMGRPPTEGRIIPEPTTYVTIYRVNLNKWLLAQTALFILGIGLSIAYGFTSLY